MKLKPKKRMLSQASTLQNLEIKSECRRNIKEISKIRGHGQKIDPAHFLFRARHGRGVSPASQNPNPISDQKMSFLTPVFRPGF